MPVPRAAVTHAYIRFGALGAMAMPMRPRPSAGVGSPVVSGAHVVPPSVDLNSPLVGPLYALLYSHGPWRAAQSTAYTVCAFAGSNATAIAPVFSSLYSTL